MPLKIKALLYLLFCWLSVQSQTNSLVVFTGAGQPFYLFVNNNPVNNTLQSNVKVFDLATGWNLIEIKMPGDIKELLYHDSILLSCNSKFLNKEFTYVLTEKEGKLNLKFKSVSEHSGPEVPPVPEAPKEVIPLVDNSIYGHLYQAVKNKPVFFNNYVKEADSCKTVLTDKEIKYALNLFNKANDDEAKHRYLIQIIDNNCYTSLQIKELIEQVKIDMDRLNASRRAYRHVTDKENISILMTMFRYPVMKENFTTFLKEEENIIKQKSLQCKEPATDVKFNTLFNSIKTTAYENEKLKLSKKLLADVCLSSIQIKKISELITHDREKIEFMKYAYNILTDKENAASLADEFQFKDAKDDFLNYISH
ncbi:MAG: DUF4476 domain-containing protein [Burkholderiales bacterium]|nr:DUF4476 domain-containing protein [Bacteroidia bacterium]